MGLFEGLTNFLSGDQWSDALNRLANSSDYITDINTPDLATLIPQLQQRVQQGTMTPAQYDAVLAQVAQQAQAQTYQADQAAVQGRMNPAVYSAINAAMQGNLSAPQFQAVQAQMQAVMSPASYQAVQAMVAGQITPQMASAALQQDSALNAVMSDQATIVGQREALGQLRDIAQQGGMTTADRAQLEAAMQTQAARTAGDRSAQLQQLQMQGQRGGGAELAARLSGSQQNANANAMAGANIAQSAQARALNALQAGLQGNQSLNTQMFQQAATKAQAQDTVNQFNAQARNQIALANAAAANRANEVNFNAQNQANLQNAAMQNAAMQQNAQNQQGANMANFGAMNQFALANQAAQNQALSQNAAMQMQANQGNFTTANQIALANQQAQNQALLTAANNMQQSNLANFNTGNQFALANQQARNQQLAQNAQLGSQANFINAQAANQVGLANAAAQNAARGQNANAQQQANLNNFNMANQINADNTSIANVQAMLPWQAAQSNFTNQLNRGVAASTADRSAGATLAGLAGQQATNSANMLGNLWNAAPDIAKNIGSAISAGKSLWDWYNSGDTASSGADALGSWSDWDIDWSWFSDENLKEGKRKLSDKGVDNIMANLTGYRYRYKGDDKERAGVMAQDLEAAGSDAVVDTPAGKKVQGPQALSEALAILANQHERIKKLEGKE